MGTHQYVSCIPLLIDKLFDRFSPIKSGHFQNNLTIQCCTSQVTVLTVLTGAVLVPFQLSRLEQVRLITEGTESSDEDEQDDFLGLDQIPIAGVTTTLTDKTIKVSPLFSADDTLLALTIDPPKVSDVFSNPPF